MAKPVSKLSADEVRAEIAALEERSELESSEQARLNELREAEAKFEAEEDADDDAVVVNVEFPGPDHDALVQAAKAHNRSKRAQVIADVREARTREAAGGKSSHEQLRDVISMRSAIDKDEHPELHRKLSEQITQLSEKYYGCKPENGGKTGGKPDQKTSGAKWNAMTVAERTALLKSAKYKPETVAKFSGRKWGDMSRSEQQSFARLMAVDEGSHESEEYLTERDGDRRKTSDRRNMWDSFFGIPGKPPKGTAERRMGNRRGSKEARVQ